MSRFIINGGKRLSGEIAVSGSKNAALPIIFACIVTRGVSRLYGVPDISDVRVALQILRSLGAVVYKQGDALCIDTTELEYRIPDTEHVSSIRASSYLLGAALSRFGRTRIQSFGGCNFDNRPIDMHIDAMISLGAVVDGDEICCNRLLGGEIRFEKISVGATVNALILAATAEGVSKIYGYAREPHVIALVDFLISAGADIHLFDEYILVVGRRLHGGSLRIIPDMIEAGTYLILSVATDSRLKICGVEPSHLESLFKLLRYGGVSLYFDGKTVKNGCSLTEPLTVVTSPYPSFPTDLQPQMASLLALSQGGVIREQVWHSRFGYLSELEKFGVKYRLDSDAATVFPSNLKSAHARAVDLRGGAALIIAALSTHGESIIESAEIIERGYENIVEKLSAVGAEIIKIN